SIEKILPMKDVGDRTRKRAEGMISNAKEITAILQPEQRAELAKKLEGKAHHMGPPQGMGQHPQAPQPPAATLSADDEEENVDEVSEPIIVGGGYRAGGVRGWGYGGGIGYGGGYVAGGYRAVGVGYGAGYPLGGYGPGIW